MYSSRKLEVATHCKTSMVNTLSWPLRCSFNLTFQCLFPYFSTQSWQPHSPISHHSHGLSYPLPAKPVKFGSMPAMCQVYGCYAFLLEREEQRKDIPSWASISASLLILNPPLHWPTLPLWLSRPHSPFTVYHKDKGRLVKWLKAWVLSQSRPELNFWSCILFFCKTRQSVSSLSVYLWNLDLLQIIWNKVFANKFPKYKKSLQFTLKFSFQRSAF